MINGSLINNSNQGFSFVESLIALIVLGIAMIGGLAFYSQASALYYTSLNFRIATSIASSRMEVCKNTGYTNLSNAAETICRDAGTTVSVGKISGTRTATVSAVTVPAVGGISYEFVTATVNWTDPSKGAQSVSLQTYVGQ